LDPILTVLEWGEISRPIGTYGPMLGVAMLVGAFLAARAGHRAHMDVGAIIAACGFTIGGSLAGASLLFVLVEWARTGSPVEAVQGGGGLVFYGAPIGGFLALWFSSKKLDLDLPKLIDLGMPAVPAAHAMGRIGCFLGGCCYGEAWEGPWAVRYTHPIAPASYPPVWRHPVPLYETVLLLLLALALTLTPPRRVGSGERLGWYLIGYALIRSFVETLRGDGVRGVWLGGLVSTSQLISMAGLAIGVFVIWRARRKPTPEAVHA